MRPTLMRKRLMLCLTLLPACGVEQPPRLVPVPVIPQIPAPLTDPVPAPKLAGSDIEAFGDYVAGYDAALAQANAHKAAVRRIMDRAEACAEQEAGDDC